MISQEAIEKILGLTPKTPLTPEEMADNLNITFFPCSNLKIGTNLVEFSKRLERDLRALKANIIPFNESLEYVPVSKRLTRIIKILLNDLILAVNKLLGLKGNRVYINLAVLRNTLRPYRVKKGISIIALGENKKWNLPMDFASSFVKSSVITIIDWPSKITENSEFTEHFDTAMDLFAFHMTNIVIAVAADKWMIYNFNASHPIYKLQDDFKPILLKSLIPKIVAPISPVKFDEFVFEKRGFDLRQEPIRGIIEDMKLGGRVLHLTGLYPKGKKISELPFRSKYYEWIGKIHLDQRNGMSYGFLARQCPISVEPLVKVDSVAEKDFFRDQNGRLYIYLELDHVQYKLKVPEVWVLTQKSGSDKTAFNPSRDLILMGLVDGQMRLKTAEGQKLEADFRPSFDTRVILAHAVGNAIICSVLNSLNVDSEFLKRGVEHGFSISHWHGYINPTRVPNGWTVYGFNRPQVSCSTPQSAIYALNDKLNHFLEFLNEGREYRGDIHIEPHHGTNMVNNSLSEFADFIKGQEITSLGNKYLKQY